MEPPELTTSGAEPGEIYLLSGQLMFMPGDPSIRCVIRNRSGARCVTKLPGLATWRESLLGLSTKSGLLWVRATQVPGHLTDQYMAQHCTRHHVPATPLADDISPQWQVFEPQRHPGAHSLSLPRGQWTALPFGDGPAFGS